MITQQQGVLCLYMELYLRKCLYMDLYLRNIIRVCYEYILYWMSTSDAGKLTCDGLASCPGVGSKTPIPLRHGNERWVPAL